MLDPNEEVVVVTTFPNWAWDVYAKAFVDSFDKYWPKEVSLLVKLENDELIPTLKTQKYSDRIAVCSKCLPEEVAFFERNKKNKLSQPDYRYDYTRFAHKIYAMQLAYVELDKIKKFEKPLLFIWADADIETTAKVDLNHIFADNGKDIFMMQRSDWDHSECSFVGYRCSKPWVRETLVSLFEMYNSDEVLSLEQWNDCFVLDHLLKGNGKQKKIHNWSKDIRGRDVFEQTVLGQFMKHKKGNRKLESVLSTLVVNEKIDNCKKDDLDSAISTASGAKIKIQTRNVVDDQIILDQVAKNTASIKNFLPVFKPQVQKQIPEPICLVSAGPSLDGAMLQKLKTEFYDQNVKIVAVKHAIDDLLAYGIIPWGCILLDPREHVANFVANAHPDVNYFVASMVHPCVVESLQKQNARIFGWHVASSEDMLKNLPKGSYFITGGSAAATRGISMLHDHLGFRKFHLFAYDCCFFEKPDLTLKQADGSPKYLEISVRATSWGGKSYKRTFWTEGQLLAQIQEFESLIFGKYDIEVYGDGVIPFIYKHRALLELWQNACKMNTFNSINKEPSLDGWLNKNAGNSTCPRQC